MDSLEEHIESLNTGNKEDFDIYRQNPDDWGFLARIIPGLVITSAGGTLPFQALGTLHGLPFYFRCRHEVAVLRLVGEDENPVADNPLYFASVPSEQIIDRMGFTKHMMSLVRKLERAPFQWQFMGRKVTVDNDLNVIETDEEEISYGWGTTPEDAFRDTQVHSEYLLDKGFTHEIQDKLWKARRLNPEPVNRDNRNWPDPEPVFEIKLP